MLHRIESSNTVLAQSVALQKKQPLSNKPEAFTPSITSKKLNASPLAMLGKSQVRFGAFDNPVDNALAFLDKKFVNQYNEVLTAGDILLDFLQKAELCDGQKGEPDFPPGKQYNSRYLYVLDKELGFDDAYIRDQIMDKLWDHKIFESTEKNRWEKFKLSAFGKDMALAWEAKEAKRLYNGSNSQVHRDKAFEILNRKFLTKGGEMMTGGKILAHLVKVSPMCDGIAGPIGFPETGEKYINRYLYVLHKDLGIEDAQTQIQVMNAFVDLKFFKSDSLSWRNKRLTANAREALKAWEADESKKNKPAAGSSSPDDELEYVRPPMDLSKLTPEEAMAKVAFPPEVVSKINEKLRMSKSQVEAGKITPWLNTTFKLPWVNETKDKQDIKRAREIFDRNFYGMDALKNRLMEEISVRKFKGGNKGGIILLVGPPGTGKTAVAKTLAQSMGRTFVRRSLAGISDAHKINGHDYTYVGAKNGMIIDAMKEAGTINPVFQIDEIDKVGHNSAQGNPHDALLAVLDPQQNDKFTDSYLEYPFDLSKVLFVCTANRIEDFPAPLLSRTEVIYFDAYLPDEKTEIAIRHLIPKQYKEYNIPKEQIEFQREAVEYLAKNYTREGGVRKLEQRIQSLFRRASLHFEENPGLTKLLITPQLIDQWLPNKISHENVDPNENRVGIVNGMYYSEAGGGVLPVQVSAFPGTGQLILTGSLGDVMRESARVALSYIKNNAEPLGLDAETQKQLRSAKLDIHVHYPDGATPKDGPSAGTSTFLSLWSALSKTPIPANVAMTGEIDLKGNAGRIGGILEKVSGSAAQGVKTIYLPKDNEKDYSDLVKRSAVFATLVKTLDIRFVKTAGEIVQDIKQRANAPQPQPAPTPKAAEPETPAPEAKAEPKPTSKAEDSQPKASGPLTPQAEEPAQKQPKTPPPDPPPVK